MRWEWSQHKMGSYVMEEIASFLIAFVIALVLQILIYWLLGSWKAVLLAVYLAEVYAEWQLLQSFGEIAMWGLFVASVVAAMLTIGFGIYILSVEHRLKCDWDEVIPISARIKKWFSDHWTKIFHHDHHPPGKILT